MVEQRPVRRLDVTTLKQDATISELEVAATLPEPQLLERRRGRCRIRDPEHDVIEIDGVGSRRLDEAQRNVRRRVDEHAFVQLRREAAGPGPLNARAEIGNAEDDPFDDAALARPVGVEQRQLSLPCVPAEQRERVRPLDFVHAARGTQEPGQPVSLVDPECDVIERIRVHAGRLPTIAAA